MPRSKQTERRALAKLSAEFYSTTWAIDVRALGAIGNGLEAGDLEGVKAILSLGRDAEPITRIQDGIAIIPVCGVLRDEVDYMVQYGLASSYQLIERDFNQALDNAQVKGVWFYFDTPGGSAIGCKRVADLIFESRGLKPIRGFAQTICGSAGFYMMSACDRAEANADALVGSVGTIMPHLEMSGFLKEIGYGATVITNADSPKKGHGNIYEPLSADAKQTLQRFVDSYGRSFINDVARYRGIEPEEVIAKYGQGDAMRADIAVDQRVIDAVVSGREQSFQSMTNSAGKTPAAKSTTTLFVTSAISRSDVMNERIKAQLFALGLIDSLDASDRECKAAMNAWAKSRGEQLPSDEAQVLTMLQAAPKAAATGTATTERPSEGGAASNGQKQPPVDEQAEARLEDLAAASAILNETLGYEAVSASMVLDACKKKLNATSAMKDWNKAISEKETPNPGARVNVTGEGADRFAADVVDAMVYRAGNKINLSEGASGHVSKPLWAVAAECLRMSGANVDLYANREHIAEQAMMLSAPGVRHTFYSDNENRQFIQASGSPAARPGDFPSILSSLARKFLDTIELDEDYSYPEVSAVLPGGLTDFKPGLMANKGIVEELDELQDAEQLRELGLQEEVLSYIFLRRFGNKWGWTPVLLANDDMNAFAEGMLGLEEAWQVTQNRMVVDRYTANENLLDNSALFANRADTGSGTNPATNNNDRTSGGTPSDAEWAAMETLYADIGGIGTGRRVRGTLNTIFVPSGTAAQDARRTFMPLNSDGLEGKTAATTANVGLYRGQVKVVVESELRVASTTKYYGLRSPTSLNRATVVRGYFNGYGQQGKRERWYDPERKTTWVSLEGRIAVAVKNWRYAIRNAGA